MVTSPPPANLDTPSPILIWQAPLVPVALAGTVGIVIDRYASIHLATSLAAAIACLFAYFLSNRKNLPAMQAPLLWLSIVCLGAAYHQWHRDNIAPNDIRLFANIEGNPVRLRGLIDSEPMRTPGGADDPLRTYPTKESTRIAVAVRSLKTGSDWLPVAGAVQAIMAGRRDDLHVGDEIEVVGRLVLPAPAANPGGFDYADYLADQGIGAMLSVPNAADALEVRRERWPGSLRGWLGALRDRSIRLLEHYLPQQKGVAAALLLGDTAGMSADAWDVYLQTGVIHVLAISGQHLVVLAGFLWIASRIFLLPRRPTVLFITALLLGYALLTGGRPAVMRAAWMVAVYAGGVILRRPVMPANTLALAWIGVAVANPTDVFHAGCQLSFLAVAVLIWGNTFLRAREEDPLQRLIDESRSWISLGLLRTGRRLVEFYAVNALVWLAVTPLVAARYHIVSPVALLIGPPMVVFSSAALLLGFGLVLSAPLLPPLAVLFGWLTHLALAACEATVNWSSYLPGAYFFVPDVPVWWLIVFYGGLLICLSVPWLSTYRRWCWAAGVGWAIIGGAIVFWPTRPTEFRCTFLAVGHGGCTVIETPDGRVIVYDAGAIAGPDVTRRHIAPFLWNSGYRRIDEIIISHGDLDHFNGLPALLDRFSVGQVKATPTFTDRTKSSIHHTMRALEKVGIELKVVHAPQQWESGGVFFEVLHPPARGPEGIENERSLVLFIHHDGLSILLTGDLEKAGLARLLSLPRPPKPVDVLMAPHHGSRTANTKELAAWARPALVVSAQGPPKSVPKQPNPYEALGARWLSTWSQGAVTIRRDAGIWNVETFTTNHRWPVRSE